MNRSGKEKQMTVKSGGTLFVPLVPVLHTRSIVTLQESDRIDLVGGEVAP